MARDFQEYVPGNTIPDFPDEEYLYFGQRVEPYFASSIVAAGIPDLKNLERNFDLHNPVRWIQPGEYFFIVKSDYEKLHKEILEKIQTGGLRYINKLYKMCRSSGNKLISFSQKNLSKFEKSEKTNEQLANFLFEYFERAFDYCTSYNIAFFEKPELEIAESLSKKYAKDEAEQKEIFDLITSPAQLTSYELEQDAFLEMRIDLGDDMKNLQQRAEAHAKEYGWLSIRFYVGRAWTTEQVVDRLRAITVETATALLRDRKAHRAQTHENMKKFSEKLDRQDSRLAQQIREVVSLRTQRADFIWNSSYFVQPILDAIAKVLKISYDDLLNFTTPEIVLALRGEYDVHAHISARKEAIVMYHADDRAVLEGEEAKKYIRAHAPLNRDAENTQVLKGQIAFKGKVQGTARVVIRNDDLKKVERGDIMVAIMTTPNFISGMEKAAGFITDEGGITCHAAIVAREMKKPCVVGTKVASKVIHDGDQVEIDALNGIVKIITRAK